MPHKTLLTLTVCVVIGATATLACQFGEEAVWVQVLLMAFVPVGMLHSIVLPLIITGSMTVFFIVLGVIAWLR